MKKYYFKVGTSRPLVMVNFQFVMVNFQW